MLGSQILLKAFAIILKIKKSFEDPTNNYRKYAVIYTNRGTYCMYVLLCISHSIYINCMHMLNFSNMQTLTLMIYGLKTNILSPSDVFFLLQFQIDIDRPGCLVYEYSINNLRRL